MMAARQMFSLCCIMLLLSVSAAAAGPCHSSHPCEATYPSNPTGDFIEVGVLLSVDLNETWALATRAMVEISIDEINNDPNTLPGTQLVAVWGPLGGVSEAGGIFSVLTTGLKDGNVFNITTRVPLLLGPIWSAVAKPGALVAAHLDIAMLSATASSPELSNEDLYPTFSRVYPADDAGGAKIAGMLYAFGYRKVAVIARNDAWGTGISTSFTTAATQLGLELLAVTQFDEDVTDGETQMKLIKGSLARIIVAFVFDQNQLFRAAKAVGMVGPKYQYIGADGLLSYPLDGDLKDLSIGALALLPAVDKQSEGYQRLREAHNAKHAANPASTFNTVFEDVPAGIHYFYDCVLFGAKALHELAASGHDLKTVSQAQVTAQLRNQTMDTGVSGLIDLNEAGDRLGSYEILNYQKLDDGSYEYVTVGYYKDAFEAVGADIIWSTGSTTQPKDAVDVQEVFEEPASEAVHVLWSLASLGLIMCVVTIVFNMKYCELRYIKMSSPVINTLIVFGCTLGYIAIFLLGIQTSQLSDKAFSTLCHARVSTLMLAFTLAFGGLFAKTWRVFRIFFNKKMDTVKITNMELFRIVGLMLVVDFIIGLSWIAEEPMQRERSFLSSFEDPNDSDRLIVPVVDSCSSPNMHMFVGAIITYKGLFIIGGAILAVLTRGVNIKALNDSKEIGLCIYTVGLVTTIVLPVIYFVNEQVTVTWVFAALSLWFNTTAVITLLFVRKMYIVFTGRDQQETISRLNTDVKSKTSASALQKKASEKTLQSKLGTRG